MTKKDTGIVDIHGKKYLTVAYRVDKFREDHKFSYGITTELINADAKTVVMKATITGENGFVVATGHAEETRGSSQINRTSALENCETSAIGRALAAFGLAGTEFASADEVANAIHQQQSTPTSQPAKPGTPSGLISEAQGKRLFAICKSSGTTVAQCANKYGFKKLGEIKKADYQKICDWAEAGIKVDEATVTTEDPF